MLFFEHVRILSSHVNVAGFKSRFVYLKGLILHGSILQLCVFIFNFLVLNLPLCYILNTPSQYIFSFHNLYPLEFIVYLLSRKNTSYVHGGCFEQNLIPILYIQVWFPYGCSLYNPSTNLNRGNNCMH